MNTSDDYPDMSKGNGFSDREVENLLAGGSATDPSLAALGRILDSMRSLADVPAPLPSSALSEMLSRGIPQVVEAAPAFRRDPQRRRRLAARVGVVSGMGLLGPLGAASA